MTEQGPGHRVLGFRYKPYVQLLGLGFQGFSVFFPKTPLGLGSRLVLQHEVRDIGPCLDGRALED